MLGRVIVLWVMDGWMGDGLFVANCCGGWFGEKSNPKDEEEKRQKFH